MQYTYNTICFAVRNVKVEICRGKFHQFISKISSEAEIKSLHPTTERVILSEATAKSKDLGEAGQIKKSAVNDINMKQRNYYIDTARIKTNVPDASRDPSTPLSLRSG